LPSRSRPVFGRVCARTWVRIANHGRHALRRVVTPGPAAATSAAPVGSCDGPWPRAADVKPICVAASSPRGLLARCSDHAPHLRHTRPAPSPHAATRAPRTARRAVPASHAITRTQAPFTGDVAGSIAGWNSRPRRAGCERIAGGPWPRIHTSRAPLPPGGQIKNVDKITLRCQWLASGYSIAWLHAPPSIAIVRRSPIFFFRALFFF
jgi:hypothetical protein